MSSWSIKGHQFCPVQYILQCHGELSSCPLSDLRKYRAHHSLLVRFQRNLVWRRHLSAMYNDGSIPSPIFLPPITPNGTKITGCFSQSWEEQGEHTGKYQQLIKFLLQRKLFSRGHQAFPCTFMCHGLYLVSAGTVINKQSQETELLWPEFPDAFWIASRFSAA